MTFNNTEIHCLTKADVKALRMATSLLFHTRFLQGFYVEDGGKLISSITCFYKPQFSKRNPYPITESEYDIQCTSNIDVYSDEENARFIRATFHMGVIGKGFGVGCDTWQTILRNIHVGDALKLHWMWGNDSDIMHNKEIHEDLLYLRVYRNGDVNKKDTFLVGNCIWSSPEIRLVRGLGEQGGF